MAYNRTAMQIGGACVEALLAEVCCTPKPGLVDRLDSGAHKDMDISTFFHSAAAIAPYFGEVAEFSIKSKLPPTELLTALRPLGLRYEAAMFAATNGVNTHKGAIYSLGLISASAGYAAANNLPMTASEICKIAGKIASPSQAESSTAQTKGGEARRNHGISGAREVAANGFKCVLELAIPALGFDKHAQYCSNENMLTALLALMTCVEDTNIVSRGGISALALVQKKSRECLTLGGANTKAGHAALVNMNNLFIEHNLSPGGSADLLAVAIALYRLEKIFGKGGRICKTI